MSRIDEIQDRKEYLTQLLKALFSRIELIESEFEELNTEEWELNQLGGVKHG